MATAEVALAPVPSARSRFRGCLLGGAVGDALGAPVEFDDRAAIVRRFGHAGIQEYVPAYGRLGAITDDTQMTLFTAEGLLRAWVRMALRGIGHPPAVLAHAYRRWLLTQDAAPTPGSSCGWLMGHRELFSQRAPGNTCLAALRESPTLRASNDSKGCGGVMRVAPVSLFHAARRNTIGAPPSLLEDCFRMGCDSAALTHGHPTGQLSSGAFAAIVFGLLTGRTVVDASMSALDILARHAQHEETTRAIEGALHLAHTAPQDPDRLPSLGRGWVAEEALAIALYCAIGAPDFRRAVGLSVNHGGDSDSTGSMTGQLLGACWGDHVIPSSWLEPLELRDVIEQVADDLLEFPTWDLEADAATGQSLWNRYPGS